jgi:hypothetical protein
MRELFRHVGPHTDIPGGDIGVGAREVGYLFGAYKKLTNEFSGALTGKGLRWGGSLFRPEAAGYGCVYFAAEMLATRNMSLEDQVCLVSGQATSPGARRRPVGSAPRWSRSDSSATSTTRTASMRKTPLLKVLKNAAARI